jgi:hypothetical protein
MSVFQFYGKRIYFSIPEEYFPFSDCKRSIIDWEVIASLRDNLYLCRLIVDDSSIIIFCIAESVDKIHYQAISRNAFYLVSLGNDGVISVWKEIKKHCWVIGFQDSVYFLEIKDDIFEQLCSSSSSFIKSLKDSDSIFTLKSLYFNSIKIDKKFDSISTISMIPIGGIQTIRIRYNVKNKTSGLPTGVSDPYISIDVPIYFNEVTGELNCSYTVSVYEQTLQKSWIPYSNSYSIKYHTFQIEQKKIE